MKRGVLVAALLVTLGGCSRQRDERPAPAAGGHTQALGSGAGATPRELPTSGAIDAGSVEATAAGTANGADAALAVKSDKVPDKSAQQQLDDQAVRMLAVLGSSGSSRGSSLDKLLSAPDIDLSALAQADKFSSGSGTASGNVSTGGSGGSILAGAGPVGGPGQAGGGPGNAAPSGPRAVITIESVTAVSGDIPDALAAVMRRFSGVRACYQRQLTQNATLAGALRVSIVIGDSGMVRSANVTPDGLDDSALVRCVSGVMQRLTFIGASTDAELEIAIKLRPEP